MKFRLLGPVEATIGGEAVPLGGVKPRVLLCTLALSPGRVVPIDRLVDLLWGDEPPDTARAVIQTYVKNLRQAFARLGAAEVIVTRSPGYALNVPPELVDALLFEQLLSESRPAEPRVAAELLGRAEALWEGPALADLADTGLAGEAARLDQLRLAAAQERFGVELALGRYDHLPELTRLVERHPTHEPLRALQMTALYRVGRQAEALASYRDARETLISQLGVEPGPELAGLHHAILRGDLPVLGETGVGAGVRIPAQLPPAPADFTGRSAELRALIEATAGVRVLSGQGGSGKSALSAKAAAALAPSYPDGQLYAELRGMHDAPATPAEVLARFLRDLGVPDDHIPDDPDRRGELFREQAAQRRLLILLDDAVGEQQVRPLLPHSPGCLVLVSSRDRLSGLDGAALVELEVLPEDQALELLTRIVGADRVAADPGSARAIVAHCGGLPLALRVAGARLVSRRRWPLSLLADRLADESRRLTELASGALAVRASIGLSYQGLAPQEKKALRRMGFIGLPDFSTWVVAWLLDESKSEADQIVEALVDAQVVEYLGVDAFGNVRYRLHDLVRLYAREQAEQEEPGEELTAAVARALGGWLSLIDQIDAQSPPEEVSWRYTISNVYRPTEQMAARASADPGNWFAAEQPSLVAGVERAAALGLHELVCEFASARYSAVTTGTNRFEIGTRINAAALSAVRAAGDVRGEAVMLAEWGKLRYYQDQYAEARQLYNESLTLFREIGDVRGQAATLAGLGTACREPGHLPEALYYLGQAVELLHQVQDVAGVAYALRLSGSVRLELGHYPEALSDLDRSLAAYQAVDNLRGQGFTLRTLGLYHRALGDYPSAEARSREAETIFQQLGDEHMEAYSVRAVAKALVRQGRGAEALPRLEWALSVCHTLGDRWGQAATLRVLGELHLAGGRLELAESFLNAALEIWALIDVDIWVARTERDLARVYRARGDQERERELTERCLKIFHDRGSREYQELTSL